MIAFSMRTVLTAGGFRVMQGSSKVVEEQRALAINMNDKLFLI
jgi:hypothetical protein